MAAYFGVSPDPSVCRYPTRAYETLLYWDSKRISDVFEPQTGDKLKLVFTDQPIAFLMCGTTDELKQAILDCPFNLNLKSNFASRDLMCVNYVRIDVFTGPRRTQRQTISLICIAQLFHWWRILLDDTELDKYNSNELPRLDYPVNGPKAPNWPVRFKWVLRAGQAQGWFPLYLQPQKKFYSRDLTARTLSNGRGRDAWFREKKDATKGFERIEARWNIRGYVNGKRPDDYPPV